MDIEAGFLIGFREALEAVLIVTVLVGLMYKTNREHMVKWIWGGVLLAIVASVLTWQIFEMFVGEFEGKNEELFEGALYLLAAVLITTVILHVIGHASKELLENKAEKAIENNQSFGIGMLAFVSVWREGVETVIFIGAGTESSEAITGLFIGIVIACAIGYMIFTGIQKVDIRFMFNISTSLLIAFAAYLVMEAMHEFGEVGLFGLPESKAIEIGGAVVYLIIAYFLSERYGISLIDSVTNSVKGIANVFSNKD